MIQIPIDHRGEFGKVTFGVLANVYLDKRPLENCKAGFRFLRSGGYICLVGFSVSGLLRILVSILSIGFSISFSVLVS